MTYVMKTLQNFKIFVILLSVLETATKVAIIPLTQKLMLSALPHFSIFLAAVILP
jgi:hypothetical protein